MKNKAIKKTLAVGMSALLLAATVVPTTVYGTGGRLETEYDRLVVAGR